MEDKTASNNREIRPLLLTVEEAAKALSCGRSTIFKLMNAGELPSITVGRLRRIRPEAVDEFIRRQTSSAAR